MGSEKKGKRKTKMEAKLSAIIRKINRFISSELRRDFSDYSQTTRNMVIPSVESGGKRVRSAIAFLISKLFRLAERDSLLIAYSIELSHAFTLIHDDLIDKPESRRGKPPLFRKVGEGLALLGGDMLMTFSFKKISLSPSSVFFLSDLMCDVIEGQILDVLWAKNGKNKKIRERKKSAKIRREIVDIQSKKTSSLFMISFVLPFLFARDAGKLRIDRKKRKEILRTLLGLGYNFGLAFQIIDDIEDVEEDEKSGGPNILLALGKQETLNLLMKYTEYTAKTFILFEEKMKDAGFITPHTSKYSELLKFLIGKILSPERYEKNLQNFP